MATPSPAKLMAAPRLIQFVGRQLAACSQQHRRRVHEQEPEAGAERHRQ